MIDMQCRVSVQACLILTELCDIDRTLLAVLLMSPLADDEVTAPGQMSAHDARNPHASMVLPSAMIVLHQHS